MHQIGKAERQASSLPLGKMSKTEKGQGRPAGETGAPSEPQVLPTGEGHSTRSKTFPTGHGGPERAGVGERKEVSEIGNKGNNGRQTDGGQKRSVRQAAGTETERMKGSERPRQRTQAAGQSEKGTADRTEARGRGRRESRRRRLHDLYLGCLVKQSSRFN